MSKNCGWCGGPSLQAICIYCDADIFICHNSIDCSWTHRGGGFNCKRFPILGRQAEPKMPTIEPSSTDDIPRPVVVKEYPAIVLATSKRAGKTYAEMLGLKNYKIVMTREALEGIRTRGIVITPGYYERVEEARYKAAELLAMTMRTGMYTNAPMG